MLRIMQLNAGSFFEPDWALRRQQIVEVIEAHKPDIICLQEIWQSATEPPSATWIADQAAGDWHFRFGGASLPPKHSPDPTVDFGSAILSRWPIEQHEFLLLPTDPESNDPTTFPWELFYVRTAGLDIFSTHLAAAPTQGDHREAQVLAIDEIISEVRGTTDQFESHGERRTGMPPILCGDFNAEPDSDEIRFLCGLTRLRGRSTFYQDAWRVAGPVDDAGYTQDWRTNDYAAALGVHRKRIDYVFVGDPFRRSGNAGRVISASIPHAFDGLKKVPMSDHEGLLVDIEWPTRPDS